MAITVEEKWESRTQTDGESVEMIYIIRGTESDVEAMDNLKGTVYTTYLGLPHGKLRIERIGQEEWIGIVPYEKNQETAPPAEGESRYTFDTTGGTQHITQSIETIERYVAGVRPRPNFYGAIGVSNDGSGVTVAGVDITVPVYNWTEAHVFPYAAVTQAYVATLYALTGKTNNALWRGRFKQRDVLFKGASGATRADGKWEMSFGFAASPTREDFDIGGITVLQKRGWDYLWVRYQDDVSENHIIKKPIVAIVEQVYEEADFAGLNLVVPTWPS
ncbi:MAG TPA: hypothetical protein VFH61_02325 [Thermoleophilia bacterium]|nr:hypothetical protein [Thermoleophilia bacterium]